MSIADFILSKSNQSIVYWGTPINDGRGKYTFSVVEQLNVRWEDEIENFAKDSRSRIRIDKDGREYRPNATLYTSTLPTGGWDLDGHVYLGALTDFVSGTSPYDIAGAYEIKQIDTLPSLNDPNIKLYVIYI